MLHQRCWVHKMRNISQKVRKRDYEADKKDARAIYLAPSPAAARETLEHLLPAALASAVPAHGPAAGEGSVRVADIAPVALWRARRGRGKMVRLCARRPPQRPA